MNCSALIAILCRKLQREFGNFNTASLLFLSIIMRSGDGYLEVAEVIFLSSLTGQAVAVFA
jgi:hypothetical protein